MRGPCVWLCVLVCVVTTGATITPAQVSLPDSVVLLLSQFTSLVEETRELLGQTLSFRPKSCKELQDNGDSGRGVRLLGLGTIHRDMRTIPVYCDHTVDGGGWMVLQRRANFSIRENFDRTSSEYREGFGNLAGEFWMGLKYINAFTDTEPYELRIDLADYEGGQRWAKYTLVYVGSTYSENSRLIVNGYTGDAGDGLTENNGQMFFPSDRDNSPSEYCSQRPKGGWWFKGCNGTNLNGYQHEGGNAPQGQGIIWLPWKGADYSLMKSTIMIRPIA